jgi:DNA-binding NtrC family response regulator
VIGGWQLRQFRWKITRTRRKALINYEMESVLRLIADRIGAIIDRLRKSEREVLRAEQLAAVGQMAAGIAHELQNPLTSMKILVQAVLEGDALPVGETEPVIGRSPGMQEVYKGIGRAAPLDVTVLITGESGTGKELVARALFHHSSRAAGPFLAINCAAIPENLLESELFGHERGAFTGAERGRIGKFEQAHGGTLFLDEIGDLSPAAQAKVLRVLQEQRFESVGGNETIQTDVRVLAATNKDLEAEVAAGRFRRDLYYRLNGFMIHLPPLRERRDDIPLLIEHFLRVFNRSLGRMVHSVTPDVLRCLQDHDWPGNVRQLQSVLKYALIRTSGDVLTLDCLPENFRPGLTEPPSRPTAGDAEALELGAFTMNLLRAGETDLYRRVSAEMDRVVLGTVLRHVKGNQVHASELLGISRTTLRAKLRALGMTGEKQLSADSEEDSDGH